MCLLSHVRLFSMSWTVAHQAPLSTGFCRQNYWSGLPFPPAGAPPDPEIELESLVLAGRFFSPAVSGDQHKASKSSEKSSQRTMSLATENLTLSSPLSVFMWASHPAASKSSCCIHSSGSATWSDTWWRRVRVLKETWLAVNSTVPHSCSSCAGKINNSLHFFLSVPICV